MSDNFLYGREEKEKEISDFALMSNRRITFEIEELYFKFLSSSSFIANNYKEEKKENLLKIFLHEYVVLYLQFNLEAIKSFLNQLREEGFVSEEQFLSLTSDIEFVEKCDTSKLKRQIKIK